MQERIRGLVDNGRLTFLLGGVFSTEQWWSVDLLAICKVHLVRVVTDVNYKPDELKHLVIRVGEITTPQTILNSFNPCNLCKMGFNNRHQSL